MTGVGVVVNGGAVSVNVSLAGTVGVSAGFSINSFVGFSIVGAAL
jgi:hypothetical protein